MKLSLYSAYGVRRWERPNPARRENITPFFRIRNASFSPVIKHRIRPALTVCSVTARSTHWEKDAAAISATQTAGTKTVQTA